MVGIQTDLLDDELVGHDGDVIVRNPLRRPDCALGGRENDTRQATGAVSLQGPQLLVWIYLNSPGQ